MDLNGDQRNDIVFAGRSGRFVFYNQGIANPTATGTAIEVPVCNN